MRNFNLRLKTKNLIISLSECPLNFENKAHLGVTEISFAPIPYYSPGYIKTYKFEEEYCVTTHVFVVFVWFSPKKLDRILSLSFEYTS